MQFAKCVYSVLVFMVDASDLKYAHTPTKYAPKKIKEIYWAYVFLPQNSAPFYNILGKGGIRDCPLKTFYLFLMCQLYRQSI